MTPELIIELPASANDPLRITRIQGGIEEDVPAARLQGASASKTVALAPALAVAHFRLPLHSRGDADARREALFAIEDDLAQPVEDVHVALGPRANAGGARDVYVVDQTLLSAWQSALNGLGLGRTPVIAESSLPWAENSAHVIGNRMIFAGPASVIGVDTELPDHAIDAIRDAALNGPAQILRGSLSGTVLPLLKQGRFVRFTDPSAAETARSGAGAWTFAALLAAACLAVWTGSIWLDAARAKSAAADLERKAATMFSVQFPGLPAPGNVHADVRRLSAEGPPEESEGFRPLAAAVYAALAADPSLGLVQMSYTLEADVLTFSLRPAEPASEAALVDRLRTAGWQVEPGGRSEAGSSFVLRAAP